MSPWLEEKIRSTAWFLTSISELMSPGLVWCSRWNSWKKNTKISTITTIQKNKKKSL